MSGTESFIPPLTCFAKSMTLVISASPPLPSDRAAVSAHSKGKEAHTPHLEPALRPQGWGERGGRLWFLTLAPAPGKKQSPPVLLLFFMLCLTHTESRLGIGARAKSTWQVSVCSQRREDVFPIAATEESTGSCRMEVP